MTTNTATTADNATCSITARHIASALEHFVSTIARDAGIDTHCVYADHLVTIDPCTNSMDCTFMVSAPNKAPTYRIDTEIIFDKYNAPYAIWATSFDAVTGRFLAHHDQEFDEDMRHVSTTDAARRIAPALVDLIC